MTDSYIPLSEAAQRAHVPDTVLSILADSGKIKSVLLHNELLLRESDVMANQPRSNFSGLSGHKIGIGEAARKYDIPQPTITRWKNRGYLKVLDQVGQKIYVDESDVAYMADFYKRRPGSGRRTDLDLKK